MKRITLTVPDAAAGTRLYTTLVRALPETPAWALRRALLARDARVNGRRVGLDALAEAGAEVVLYLPDYKERTAFAPVYEDENILIARKPAGVPSCDDPSGGETMAGLAARYAAERGEPAPFLCHRLDAMTGGLLLFAKGAENEALMRDAFERHLIEKTYVCVVRGAPSPRAGTLRAYLRKDARAARVAVLDHPAAGARTAELRYRVTRGLTAAEAGVRGERGGGEPARGCTAAVANAPVVNPTATASSPPFTRLEIALITGRTHQIRAQFAHIGCPVLGDEVYGDWALNQQLRPAGLRLFAQRLAFGTLSGALSGLSGRAFETEPPF